MIPKDILFMQKALELAKRGEGCVHPNPLVGAVIVKHGVVIGQAHHERFGGPHAEARAIQNCRENPKGATLYVTLEPCSHVGKTPPCSDAVIRSGVKRVVIGAKDQNPLVNGRGIRRLKNAGIQVSVGILEKEASDLNADFNRWVRDRMPYAVIKLAQSLDGKIATKTGESRWISGQKARDFSQALRASSDAILVGVNTLLTDDPALNVRNGMEKKKGFKAPFKVVLDSFLRTPLDAKIFSEKTRGPVILATTRRAKKKRLALLRKKAQVLILPGKKGRVDLELLFRELARRGIVRVLVEGGGEVTADILGRKLAQEITWFVAPRIIGGRRAVASVGGEGVGSLKDSVTVHHLTVRPVGGDLLIHGYLS